MGTSGRAALAGWWITLVPHVVERAGGEKKTNAHEDYITRNGDLKIISMIAQAATSRKEGPAPQGSLEGTSERQGAPFHKGGV